MKIISWIRSMALAGAALGLPSLACGGGQQIESSNAPVVTKVEPPNWWIGLTPELMLLVSGHHLEATRVGCNLQTVHVMRTSATAGGEYLFIWLKIGLDTRTGTAVCRVTTPSGVSSFELPIAARAPTAGKFQGLSQDDVLYLIMPDRFANGDPTNDDLPSGSGARNSSKPGPYHGGDLRGISEHLSYLKDLGVTTLQLTPIVKHGAAQDSHGYGAVDLYDVEPHLGTIKDYQQLVSATHRQGMKFFFDAVPNHVGPKHPWVSHPPLPDWFHGTPQHHLESFAPVKGSFYEKPGKPAVTNDLFEALVDPHAPASLKRNLTEGWFFGILPDLNTENPIVAQYLLQNSIWWTETSGLDGLRLDTFPYVARRFWAAWHAELRRVYPNLTTVGEVFHPDPTVTSFFVGGQKRWDGIDSGLTTVVDFPLYSVLRDVLLRGSPVGKIPDVLRYDALYAHPEALVTFFDSPDTARFASAEGSSAANVKLAFGLTLTLRGISQLYYGDEIGMRGGTEPDSQRDFPGGSPQDTQNAFTEAGRTREQQEIFKYVQTLLRLRREHEALRTGRLWHMASDTSSYVFLRETEDERLLVVFNNAEQSRELHIPLLDTPARQASAASLLFGEAAIELSGVALDVKAPARSLSIFSLN